MTKREKAERLYQIFKERLDEIKYYGGFGYSSGASGFDKYMERRLKPHARTMRCEFLVSIINDDVDSVAVRHPDDHDRVIVLETEYADKILVLGLP